MKISACILFNYSVPSPETFPIKENNNLDLSELTERIFNWIFYWKLYFNLQFFLAIGSLVLYERFYSHKLLWYSSFYCKKN